MDGQYLLILTILISFLLLLIQRTEPQKRFKVILIMLVVVVLIRNWVRYREIQREAIAALIIALIINFLFWWLIGRYNPVTSSDNIQVLGMDD